ncbi:DUF2797 domain-containing protein [Effusibacillus dendaii]|uniref:DUF2797 domain-containing protein n=1 Tax=Effusibacillus dendaii TaxID=2743772 RepID=A0A7I8D6Q4_9BACL|nr:DUF2797 domain-containing protein [Effusibacillus dendaii]BCJ85765.1 hypothetical protein skT53_07500 [Effusibacillus dendaii]
MSFTGFLNDLEHEAAETVEYYLVVGEQRVALNRFLGQSIEIRYLGEKACCVCGRKANKLFNNGYCYPCFTTLAECDLCIVKPHQCHHHLGTCRDNQFAEEHCMTPHYVYLALSSGVKVGITRKSRGKARWIDQGAVEAIPIAEVPTRKLAGELEVLISEQIPDKTNWRKMLSGQIEAVDLLEIRRQVLASLPAGYESYLLEEQAVYQFAYPMLETLDKITSFSFDKQDSVAGRLIGIKGQYLIFEDGVLNVKKHAGYKVNLVLPE